MMTFQQTLQNLAKMVHSHNPFTKLGAGIEAKRLIRELDEQSSKGLREGEGQTMIREPTPESREGKS